jgi:hypothetical protein
MLQYPILPNDLQIRIVTEEWVGQLERSGKRLLGKETAGAEPKNLDV